MLFFVYLLNDYSTEALFDIEKIEIGHSPYSEYPPY